MAEMRLVLFSILTIKGFYVRLLHGYIFTGRVFEKTMDFSGSLSVMIPKAKSLVIASAEK